MFQKIVCALAGRTTAFCVAFFVTGNVMHALHRLDRDLYRLHGRTDGVRPRPLREARLPTRTYHAHRAFNWRGVGEWIFAFEPRRIVSRSKIGNTVNDIVNLLDYSKAFPQNM